MWNNSNTKEAILKELKESGYEEHLHFFENGRFEYFGGYWFVVLLNIEKYIKEVGCVFYIETENFKIKVVDPQTDIIKMAKILHSSQQGAKL